jgi:hypothetical protein
MNEKLLNRLVVVLLISALAAISISPVLAADSETVTGNTDPVGALARAGPQENIEGYDQDLKVKIPAPQALTEVNGLVIDPALVNATPYWVYLAAGKKEQQALIDYIRNADLPSKKKTEWVQFLQVTWKKYPLKFVKTGSSAILTPVKPLKEYSLTKNEAATFAGIDGLIAADITNTASQEIHPMFAGDQHKDIVKIALKTENYIPENFKQIAIDAAPVPDNWYPNDEAGFLLHSMNHGYMPTGVTDGLGLAPQNTGTYALAAKASYMTHNYNNAFTSLGYSSHFMGDLGQPFHTPSPVLLAQPEWIYYAGPPLSTLSAKVKMYQIFHDHYEGIVDSYWTKNLTGNTRSLSDYANADNGATIIINPVTSATYHADASSVESIPLFYLYEWHFIVNRDFNYMSDPRIAALTIDRVKATTENTRGLVRFVTGQQAPTLTITASKGEHGNITPSGSVTINYGDNQIFTITPDNGFIVDQILVDGSLVTENPYTFTNVTSDHSISATFRQPVCSMLTFTDPSFQYADVQQFNSGDPVPAGNYTLNVTGWNSPWSSDHGWWEEGVTGTTFKAAAWRNLTNLRVEGDTTPLSTIVNGTFARENSTGSAYVNLSSPSRVGIIIIDSTYSDNRGAATFVLSDAGQTCSATAMKELVNVLPSRFDVNRNVTIANQSVMEPSEKSST